jgi:hypothetical protein
VASSATVNFSKQRRSEFLIPRKAEFYQANDYCLPRSAVPVATEYSRASDSELDHETHWLDRVIYGDLITSPK